MMKKMESIVMRGRKMLKVILCGIAFMFVVTMAFAQDAKTIAKNAGNELRISQRKMFSKKYQDAKAHLDKAKELFEQLKKADPDSIQVKILTSKIAKQEKDLNKRMGVTDGITKSTFKLPPKPNVKEMPGKKVAAGSQKAATGKKLPGGVKNRLKKVDRILQRGDKVLTKKTVASNDSKVEELQHVIKKANTMIDEINKRYAADIPQGNAEMKQRLDKIAEFKAKVSEFKGGVEKGKADAANKKAEQEKQSNEWHAKLNPYVNNKKGNTKYLIASGTADETELSKRKKVYDELVVFFAEYQKTEFPAGKSEKLKGVETDVLYAIKTFDAGYKQSLGNYLNQAERKLTEADSWVNNKLKQNDGKTHIYPLGKDRIPDINKLIAKAASSVGKDNPKVIALHKKVAELEKKNAKLKAIKVERTVMTPDKFKGKELSTVKSQALTILQKKHSGTKSLRTTVISPAWKEEKVVEYTDTTKTKARYRITQSVTTQIAGKKDGKVCLYTIHVARNKNSDGSWGPLYGNVMFIDDMLEKNVNK
jgi:hypothetical protein